MFHGFRFEEVAAPPGPAPVLPPSPSPDALGAVYWWDAASGVSQDGVALAWTDAITGVTLTNATAANGVSFGAPMRVANADHDGRPSILTKYGALHAAVAPMAATTPLAMVVIAKASAYQFVRLFSAVGSDLAHTSGRWSVNARGAALYVSNRYRNFLDAPAYGTTDQSVHMFEWCMDGTRGIAGAEARVDGIVLAPDTATSTTLIMSADFPHVVIGGTPGGAAVMPFADAEIEHVMLFLAADMPTIRPKLEAWWADRQAASRKLKTPRNSIVLQYGQSNAVGMETAAATTYSRHGNLCFAGALETWVADVDGSGGANRAAVQALKERSYESGMAHGLERMVDRSLLSAGAAGWRDLPARYFALNPSASGHSIEQLGDGDFPRLIADLSGAAALGGAGARLDWIWWVQGFSNASGARAAYAPKLTALLAEIEARAAASGIAGDAPHVIIGQHCTSRTNAAGPMVSLDQLAVADARAKTAIFPLYQLPWKNGTHLSTLGQQLKGEYFAKVMHQIAAGSYAPVRFTVADWTAAQIVVSVTGGVGGYQFDTATIPAAPNMGFDIWGADDVTLHEIISNVSILGDQITISLSSAAPNGARLGYGWGRAGMAQPSTSPYALGNLRDADPDQARILGANYSLYNWGLISEAQQG